MPDVGVLELKIRDNAETAAGGLTQLSGALSAVKTAVGNGIKLSSVADELVNLKNVITEAKAGKTIASLGTMFNAVNKFSNIKKFSINANEIRDIAQNMLKLADATDAVNKSNKATSSVANGRFGMETIAENTREAVNQIEEQVDKYKNVTDRAKEIAKEGSYSLSRMAGMGIYSTSPGKKQVPGQIAMDLDGTAQKIQEVVRKISVTDAAATSIADKIEDTGKKFASAVSAETITSPLERISDTFRNMTTNIRYYGSALDTVIPKVQALSSVEMIEAGNARYAAMSEREQMLVMAEATGKIKSIKEMNTNDVFVGMEQTTERIDQMNISLRETGDIVESIVIPRFQEMYAIWSQWAYEFNAFQMEGSRLMSGNSPMLLGDGRTVGQLLLGDGSEPQTFLSTWVDTGEQFRTNWVMFTSDVAEQWRAQWSPDWILGGWNVPQSMSTFHLGAGTSPLLLGDGGVSQENALSTMVDYSEQWKQNWIYGEGTVTDTVEETERVAAATRDASNEAEAYAARFEQILKEQEEAAALAASIREQQEAAFNGTNNRSAAVQNTAMAAVSPAALDAQWLDNLVENASEIDLLNMKIESMTDRLYEGATSGRMTGEQIADLVARIQSARDKIEELNGSMAGHIDIIGGVSSAYKYLKTGIERMFPTLTSLIHQFTRMAKMRAIRYIIRQIASAFKEGIENVYRYSQAVGNSFAPSMDSAASSLATMKNALGAAAAPLLQSLIPVLQSVVNWFINLINYVNQFIALLRGQTSWIRATPQTTTAFDKQEKAAKKAGNAIKDLLADWDELNIIQSNTSGANGATGTSAAEDYLSMFEEVTEFDSKIKNIVQWIQDHMDEIRVIAETIGAAILMWKFSNAFLTSLSTLAGIASLGLISLGVGLQLTWMGAYSAGYNGHFDTKSLLETAGGILLSVIGAGLLGYAIAGPWGFVTGAAVGLIASIAVAVKAYHDGELQKKMESKWGKLHLTQEQINELVDGQVTAKVIAGLKIVESYIENKRQAKKEADEAIEKFSLNLQAARFKLDADNSEAGINDALTAAKAAIDAIQVELDNDKEGLKLSFTKFTYTDKDGNDITSSLYSNMLEGNFALEQFFNDMGRQIAEFISKGFSDGMASEEAIMAMELMESYNKIITTAEKEYQLNKYVRDTKNEMGNVYDLETANSIYDTQIQRLDNYKATTQQQIEEDIDSYYRTLYRLQGVRDYFKEKGDENAVAKYDKYIEDTKTTISNNEKWLKQMKEGTYKWSSNEDYMTMYRNMKEAWENKLREFYKDSYLNYLMNGGENPFDYNPVATNIMHTFGISSSHFLNDEELDKYFKDMIAKYGGDQAKAYKAIEERAPHLLTSEFVKSTYFPDMNKTGKDVNGEIEDYLFGMLVSDVAEGSEKWDSMIENAKATYGADKVNEVYNNAFESLKNLYNQMIEDMFSGYSKGQMTQKYAEYERYVNRFMSEFPDAFKETNSTNGGWEGFGDWNDNFSYIAPYRDTSKDINASVLYTAPEDAVKGQDGNVFKQVYDDIVGWWQNSPFAYKPPQELTENMVVKIDDAGVVIEDPDGLRQELEDQVNYLLRDSRLEDWERNALNQTYGEELVRQVLNDLQYTFDEEGYLTGHNMTTLQRLAASGVIGGGRTISDVGWNNTTIAQTEADMQSNISSGTEKGTQDMLSVLRDLLSVVQSINRKDFTVTITPTSTLGAAMTRSVGMYDRITG